jgi:hypothetical protein
MNNMFLEYSVIKFCVLCFFKKITTKGLGAWLKAQVVECLPRKYEATSSNSRTEEKMTAKDTHTHFLSLTL